jgi:hypothetical protein
MLVYRCDPRAHEILSEGFRDATGTYLTENEYAGVWVADEPLSGGDGGVFGEHPYVVVDIPEEVIAEFEWVEDLKTYREWLVPAALLNQYPRHLLDDLDE